MLSFTFFSATFCGGQFFFGGFVLFSSSRGDVYVLEGLCSVQFSFQHIACPNFFMYFFSLMAIDVEFPSRASIKRKYYWLLCI